MAKPCTGERQPPLRRGASSSPKHGCLPPKIGVMAWSAFVAAIGLLAVPSWLWIGHYASFRRTPLYAYASSFVGYLCALGAALLLPADIVSSSHRQCLQATPGGAVSECPVPLVLVPEWAMLAMWQSLYWTSFVLCWLVYPLLQGYDTAGDFTALERLRTSVKDNAWFYGCLVLAVLVLFAVFLMSDNGGDPLGMAMALSNAWGLFLALCLLAYGLVELPRKVLRAADLETMLRRCRFEAAMLDDRLRRAEENLTEKLSQVRKYEEDVDRRDVYWPYVATIVGKCPETRYIQVTKGRGRAELRYDMLVSLHTEIKSRSHEVSMNEALLDQLARHAIEIEDVLTSREAGEGTVRWSLDGIKPYNPRSALSARLEYVWFGYLRGWVLSSFGTLLVCLSLLVLWCESVFAIPGVNLSVFSLSVKSMAVRTSYLYLPLILAVPLVFMMACTYWTLFQLRLLRYFRMVRQQQTDPNSLMLGAAYLCRLAPPLTLNFLRMLQVQDSSFQKVMKGMETLPVLGGTSFNNLVPLILLGLCIGVHLNLGTRLLRFLHIRKFDYDSPSASESTDSEDVLAGKLVIQRVRSKLVPQTVRSPPALGTLGPLEGDLESQSIRSLWRGNRD